MAIKPGMRTSLALLLGKIETTRGVDPLPNSEDDAFLVGDMDFQLDPTLLERNVFRRSFSPVPTGVGRKQVNVTFSHELKGSGTSGIRPKLGTLLRACGMRELLVTAGAATQIETPHKIGPITQGAKATWTKDTAPTALYGSYLITAVGGTGLQVTRWGSGEIDETVMPNMRHDARVNDSAGTILTLDDTDAGALTFTVGGAPTTGDDLYAIVGGVTFPYTVTSADADAATVAANLAAIIDADPRLTATVGGVGDEAVITVGFVGNAAAFAVGPVTLGASGASVTPTITGTLIRGQQWVVSLYEVGYTYRPTSVTSEAETITLYVMKDGVLHKVSSCMGTVTFTGESGQIGQAQFEFTGNYDDPVEEPIPLDANFEGTDPPQVELAQMSINGDNDFCAQSFTYTLGNDLNLRECINAKDGFDGSQITGRSPTAALNPDATYEAYTGMWGNFSRNKQFPLHTRVGIDLDNMVRFYAERANFTGLTYGDRNNAVTLECEFQLNGLSAAGDDELRVTFPASA